MKEKKNKINQKIFEENNKVLLKLATEKQKRHVKEPTEPVFKDILNEFSVDYAKKVVVKTMVETLKYYKNVK